MNKTIKFIQELTWRDYWQQVWTAKGDAISWQWVASVNSNKKYYANQTDTFQNINFKLKTIAIISFPSPNSYDY